jgi:hypothetical protein
MVAYRRGRTLHSGASLQPDQGLAANALDDAACAALVRVARDAFLVRANQLELERR